MNAGSELDPGAPYFADVEKARRSVFRRLTGDLPAGPGRFLGLLADGELRHGRPRRCRRLLAQAGSRLDREGGVALAGDLRDFATLLAGWPAARIRGQGLSDLVLAGGLHHLALQRDDLPQPRPHHDIHRLALLSARRVLPAHHPQLVDLELHFARSLAEAGQSAQALEAVARAEAISDRLPWPALRAFCRGQHAEILFATARPAGGARLARTSLALYRRCFEPDHPALLPALRRLSRGGRRRDLDQAIARIFALHLGDRPLPDAWRH